MIKLLLINLFNLQFNSIGSFNNIKNISYLIASNIQNLYLGILF